VVTRHRQAPGPVCSVGEPKTEILTLRRWNKLLELLIDLRDWSARIWEPCPCLIVYGAASRMGAELSPTRSAVLVANVDSLSGGSLTASLDHGVRRFSRLFRNQVHPSQLRHDEPEVSGIRNHVYPWGRRPLVVTSVIMYS
jgi:hypothetical protein